MAFERPKTEFFDKFKEDQARARSKGLPGSPLVYTPGGPLSSAEITANQEASQAREQRNRVEAEAEADRIALEQLRIQKESEVIEYKNKYFAAPQIGIYIGDKWLGNAVTIEFTENVSKSPLYGYASSHFDAVVKGNTIVQGTLTIVYTGENYLPSILESYRKGEGAADSLPFEIKDPVERAKKLFWNLESVSEPVETKPLEYGYTGGKTGTVLDGFNIRLFYGSQNFLVDSFEKSGELAFTGPQQTIQNVHLTSRSIVIQPSGDPIGEAYTFFARSVTTSQGRRQSINPNKVVVRRDGTLPIATPDSNSDTGLRFGANIAPL